MDSSNRNPLRSRARRQSILSAESLEGRQLLSMGGIGTLLASRFGADLGSSQAPMIMAMQGGVGRQGASLAMSGDPMQQSGTASNSPYATLQGSQGNQVRISNGSYYGNRGGFGWQLGSLQNGDLSPVTTLGQADTTGAVNTPSQDTTSGAVNTPVMINTPGQGTATGAVNMPVMISAPGQGGTSSPTNTPFVVNTSSGDGGAIQAGGYVVSRIGGKIGVGGFGQVGDFGSFGGFGPGQMTLPQVNGGTSGSGAASTGTTTSTGTATSPVVTALKQYQTDVQKIADSSQVTPALESALTTDLQTLNKAATTAPDQTKVLALESDLKTFAGSVPTSDQLATLQTDFTAVVNSEGVTDQTTISKTFTDLGALITATNISTADVTTLTADLKAAGMSTNAPLGSQLGVNLDVLTTAINAKPTTAPTSTTTSSSSGSGTTTS
ncbi:MAG TPA: hypothetical protein VGH33_27470 [Isosphaeraceae bacterium]|jgi:hypothetical protein